MEGIGQPVPHPQGSAIKEDDNFDRVLEESEEEIARLAKQHNTGTLKEQVLELDEISLRCPKLDDDPTFK